MYYAGNYMTGRSFDRERLHEIRERESVVRDEKARKMMEQVRKERLETGRISPRGQVKVSRNMKHLPKPGIQ